MHALARGTIYTDGKSVDEIADEIADRAGCAIAPAPAAAATPLDTDRSSLAQSVTHAESKIGHASHALRTACEVHYALRSREAPLVESADADFVSACARTLDGMRVPEALDRTSAPRDPEASNRAQRLYETEPEATSLPALLAPDPAFFVFPLALSGLDDSEDAWLTAGYFRRPQRSRFLVLHAACAAMLARAVGIESKTIAARARIAEALASTLACAIGPLHAMTTAAIAERVGRAAAERLDALTWIETSFSALFAHAGATDAIADVVLDGLVLPLASSVRPLPAADVLASLDDVVGEALPRLNADADRDCLEAGMRSIREKWS